MRAADVVALSKVDLVDGRVQVRNVVLAVRAAAAAVIDALHGRSLRRCCSQQTRSVCRYRTSRAAMAGG